MSPLATYVVETLVTLLAITVLAVLVVYGARRMGVGRPTGPLQLLGRLPLDARRVIYLVRVDKKVMVLGTEPSPGETFQNVLGRVLGKRKAGREDAA